MKDKDLLRYSRHIMLPEIDIEGQRKISSAKVAIIGLGGLGCSASIFLTSSGVGELCLVDDDVIDLSNLQRQILFSESDVDKGKILAAKESLSSLNKDIKLIAQNLKITASNIDKTLNKFDYVLDCTDNFDTRKIVNSYCFKTKKILISGSSQGWKGQFFKLNFHHQESPCYECFFEDLSGEDLSCRESSIFSPLVGIVGSFMASELLKEIVSIEKFKPELIEIDLKSNKFKRLNLKKNEYCKLCSKV